MPDYMMEKEVEDALAVAASGLDFLVKGGAGSGKTYSMLSFLEQIYRVSPEASVACITFTNVAVNEIKSRFSSTDLHVATIHDFVWGLINRYQKNLRSSLAELINRNEVRSALKVPITSDYWSGPIRYKEWLDLEAGAISHNEVLKVAEHLFSEYPRLARILGDRYDFLLVDEYQDTPTTMLRILLEELPAPADRNMRIGFFGDGQQSIHEENKGDQTIQRAVASNRLVEIEKTINRRNPSAVIRVINHLRADNLKQIQANDPAAPNYQKHGSARFIYTTQKQLTSESIRELDFCRGWDFTSAKTKLLYLGKAMIAEEMQFPRLMEIYTKDRVVEYAKRINKFMEKQGVLASEELKFGQALELYGASVAPTPTQQRAFDGDPTLLNFASKFMFKDVSSTSLNSDRLIGTKKVSEFDERDRGEKRDDLINHLMAIQELRDLYHQRKFSQVIRMLDFSFTSIREREKVAADLAGLDGISDAPIREVIAYADTTNLLRQKDALLLFREKHPYRYARVADVPFSEVASLYAYVEDYSPYSTQHGVKGAEWDNIFVSLDNGGWNKFNFEKLMANPNSTETVEARSRMMLYVTCSRAKENLIVYAHQPSDKMLNRAKEWFGQEHVVSVG